MKLVVIDNYDSFVFNLVRYLEENENCDVSVMRNDTVDYDQLDTCDGILLSPGPGIPKNAGDLMKVVEKYHSSKPILGVCLGHQAISEYFDCELIQNDRPLHGKSSLISHNNESILYQGIPVEFEVGRYHSWSIDSKGTDSMNITASTSDGEIMSIEHKELPLFGVQFHPESILTPNGRTIINNFVKYIQQSQK